MPESVTEDDGALRAAVHLGDVQLLEKLLKGLCTGAHLDVAKILPPLQQESELEITATGPLEWWSQNSSTGLSIRWPVLHDAVIRHNYEAVRILIQGGVDVNCQSRDSWCYSWTALHVAADSGSAQIARLLLQNGADVSMTTSSGFSPLHLACGSNNLGQLNVVDVLLQHGAEPRNRTYNMYTPLHLAAHYARDPKILNILVNRGATIDGRTRTNSKTALHYAARRCTPVFAITLLKLGADTSLRINTEEDETAKESWWVLRDAQMYWTPILNFRIGDICSATLFVIILAANRMRQESGGFPIPVEVWYAIFAHGTVLEWNGRRRSLTSSVNTFAFD